MELDDAYANSAHIPNSDLIPPRLVKDAQAFRDRMGARAVLDIPYGDSPRQVFDLFRPEGTPKGLFVFVHGGYWRMTDKSMWSHLASGMLSHGWAVAMPSYDLCPDVRIADITRQVATAVTRIADEVAGPVLLAGHSAGGHLAARMVCRGVLPDAMAGRLRHVLPISPVVDLRPMLKTSMNADFMLDQAGAEAESPVLCRDRHDVPVTVWVGGDERPAFLDQAQWLEEAWGCGHVIDAGKHHFNVIDGLLDENSAMVQTLLNGE